MTNYTKVDPIKYSAQERVRECKERVINALRQKPSPLSVYRHDDPLRRAWDDLYEAESALADLDKPRLMTPCEAAARPNEAVEVGEFNRRLEYITRDRQHILIQAEKLSTDDGTGLRVVLLSDLRNLINGTNG